jgi:UDP-2-acetamido-2,6-beta-L-arabino-hexul-4-ose reductase
MHIVVTGGAGFLGRNLRLRLRELGHERVTSVERDTPREAVDAALATADFVVHLAGVNRPPDPSEFDAGNRGATAALCDALRATGRAVPLAFTSSIQADRETPYGASKRAAEREVARYGADTGAATYVYRLANVFGKWCRPNYNSAVATFCHNIARGLPVEIHDPAAPLRLVYVDDVVDSLVGLLGEGRPAGGFVEAGPVYETTVGSVAALLREYADSRRTLRVARVGVGLERALYATYVSYLPPSEFAYALTRHVDPRGTFAEVLKTAESGQFSVFTARPGVTRGGHYHHTKTEKFLVVQGTARFGFRHVLSGETHELLVSGADLRVVETVPGWAHDVTNVGGDEMIVMLWANELFDPARPDTVVAPLRPPAA